MKTEEVDPYGLYVYSNCFLEKFKSSKRKSTNKWKFAIIEIQPHLRLEMKSYGNLVRE